MKLLRIVPFTVSCLCLSGCLVGGVIESAVVVYADESTVKPELKRMLSTAKSIALLTAEKSQSAISTAEYLDLHGGYRVTIESVEVKGWTPSQKRDAMKEICRKNKSVDIVAAAMSSNNDAGGGTTIKGAVTGRVSLKIVTVDEILQCKTNLTTTFSIITELDQGIYNADQVNIDKKVGVEAAKLFLKLAGKTP